MTTAEFSQWFDQGRRNGWQMPQETWWRRVPVIRHIRAMKHKIAVERWYAAGPGIIGLRTGYDDWVLCGMWHGFERPLTPRSTGGEG